MQKRPSQPPPSGPPGRAMPGDHRPPPNLEKKVLARPMVTADERRQAKEARRATTFTPPAQPAAAGQPAAPQADPLQQELDRFNNLQSQLMLTQIRDDLEDVESAINALPANIENIRSRGYVFKSYLERKVETLTSQWRDMRPRVEAALQQQANGLSADAAQVQARLSRRQTAGPALSGLEAKVGAALRSLQGMYDTLDDNVNQTQKQIDDISWSLQQAEQASFGFLPTEGVVEAVPANWKKPGDKDGVDGILYLTDQRLIFEQKEEVATKRVLFIATEKQKVQALAWAVPVAQIDKAVGSKRGFMNKDDFLTVTLVPTGAFQGPQGEALGVNTTDIHLKGEDGATWQGWIGRVKSGEIAKERTVPVDPAAAQVAANAPTKCSTCGATFTQTILRGQTEITCEYCGSVTRL